MKTGRLLAGLVQKGESRVSKQKDGPAQDTNLLFYTWIKQNVLAYAKRSLAVEVYLLYRQSSKQNKKNTIFKSSLFWKDQKGFYEDEILHTFSNIYD